MQLEEVLVLAPEFSIQLLALRPDLARFIHARRRHTRVFTPEADDEVQEVLAEIMQSLPHYRAELGEFRPWAFGIAINVHRRIARLQKRQNDWFSQAPLFADNHESQDPSPERWAQIHQARMHIDRVHRAMPPKQFVALYLFAVEEYSHPEIAAEFGITEAASKQLVHRAREYLDRHGMNETTFFSAPPLNLEIRMQSRPNASFWARHYDWTCRVGHGAVLLMAVTFATQGNPVEFAQARLRDYQAQISANFQGRMFTTNPSVPMVDEITPPIVIEEPRKKPPIAANHLDKRPPEKVRVSVEGVTLLPRKTR